MTVLIDALEEAARDACDALADLPQYCGCCDRYDCREREDAEQLAPLAAAVERLGDAFDARTLRLDSDTASVLLHPRFPRYGVEPRDADADVIPEVLQLPLSSGREAAAIVWHLAQGRPDQDALAREAEARWDELQELAGEVTL